VDDDVAAIADTTAESDPLRPTIGAPGPDAEDDAWRCATTAGPLTAEEVRSDIGDIGDIGDIEDVGDIGDVGSIASAVRITGPEGMAPDETAARANDCPPPIEVPAAPGSSPPTAAVSASRGIGAGALEATGTSGDRVAGGVPASTVRATGIEGPATPDPPSPPAATTRRTAHAAAAPSRTVAGAWPTPGSLPPPSPGDDDRGGAAVPAGERITGTALGCGLGATPSTDGAAASAEPTMGREPRVPICAGAVGRAGPASAVSTGDSGAGAAASITRSTGIVLPGDVGPTTGGVAPSTL
jgi:hypothetical protein